MVPILQKFSYILCFFFDDFHKPLVIQGLSKPFRLIFIFCFGNALVYKPPKNYALFGEFSVAV